MRAPHFMLFLLGAFALTDPVLAQVVQPPVVGTVSRDERGVTQKTPVVSDTSPLGLNGVADAGQSLAARGIYFNGLLISQIQGVTAGGLSHGVFPTNWLVAGIDLDLERMAGIPGASIHLQTNDLSGQGNYASYNASNWVWLDDWANHNGYQLRELTWDQHLFGDHVLLLAGRSNPRGAEFDGSDLYCLFATVPCGVPGLFASAGGSPTFEAASWSARITLKPSRISYVKAGIWEDEPSLRDLTGNGWPGGDWGLDRSTGAFIPVEAGIRTGFTNDPLPRQYDIGFTYDSAAYNDPLLNTQGKPLPLSGGALRERKGRSTVYLQAQQMVFRPDATSRRGLSLFGAADFGTSGELSMRDSFILGGVLTGPLASRPADTVGLVVETFLFGDAVRQRMRDKIGRTGRPGDMSGSETALEANYGALLLPGCKAEPYAAYIWHPDQLASARPVAGITHAVQLGIMLTLDMNAALALPKLVRMRF